MSTGVPPASASNPRPSQLKEFYGEWYNLIQMVAGTAIAVVGFFFTNVFGPEQHQAWVKPIGYVLSVALVGAAILAWRLFAPRPDLTGELGAKGPSAWRPFDIYSESDKFDLPGSERRVEADQFALKIQRPGFSFGVISGDTGCGKSSFLASGLLRRLKAANVAVEIVRSPRSLLKRAGAPPEGERRSRKQLDLELTELKRLAVDRTSEGTTTTNDVVLIIDQFEEFFIDYPRKEHRHQIGQALAELNGDPHVKVLCAVRKDYVLDLHDFADSIPEPLATSKVTHLKNFTPDEAAKIILELCSEAKLSVTESFAERVARELTTERGDVRPPELQIVCSKLRGGLNDSTYEKLGGAKGILAEYIEQALVGCRDRSLARRLLAELSDFPARAKKPLRSFDELQIALGAQSSADATLFEESLRQALKHLDDSRLLNSEPRDGTHFFALAADYLVEAIALATRDVSSRAQEAEQLLNFYTREAHEHLRPWWWVFSNPVIPWTKLRFITKNADAQILKKKEVRSLLMRSTVRHFFRTAGLGTVVAVITAALFTLLTVEKSWQLKKVEHHWPEGIHGPVALQIVTIAGKTAVLTQSGHDSTFPHRAVVGGAPNQEPAEHLLSKQYLRLWSPTDGKLLGGVSGRFLSDPDSDLPIVLNGSLWQVKGQGEKKPLQVLRRPFATLNTNAEGFDLPPDALKAMFSRETFWLRGNMLFYVTVGPNQSSRMFHAYAIDKGRALGELQIDTGLFPTNFRVESFGADRALLFFRRHEKHANQPDRNVLTFESYIWKFGEKSAVRLDLPAGSSETLAVDPMSDQLAVLIDQVDSKKVRCWPPSVGDFVPLAERRFKERTIKEQRSGYPSIRFVGQNQLLLQDDGGIVTFEVWSLPEMEPTNVYPGRLYKAPKNLRDWYGRGGVWLAWSETGKTKIWNMTGQPYAVTGLDLSTERPVLQFDQQAEGEKAKALSIDSDGKIEIWELAESGKLIIRAKIAGAVYGAGFTVDGRGTYVRTEGGILTVYDATEKKRLPVDLTGVGGDAHVVSYDPTEGSIIVWTSEGRILHYEWTWTTWLYRWFGQSPSTSRTSCPQDEPVEPSERRLRLQKALPAPYDP